MYGLKYQRSTTSCCRDVRIRKFKFGQEIILFGNNKGIKVIKNNQMLIFLELLDFTELLTTGTMDAFKR